MAEQEQTEKERRPLIRHDHRKRSVRAWVVPLVIIVAIIIFLPKIVALLEK
jgi:hypothetical protein